MGYGLIKVRFVKPNGNLSKDSYSYYIKEDILGQLSGIDHQIEIKNTFTGARHLSYPMFNIKNKHGYDYRKSPIIITEKIFVGENPLANHSWIIELVPYQDNKYLVSDMDSGENRIVSHNEIIQMANMLESRSKTKDYFSASTERFEKYNSNDRKESNMFENIMKNIKFGKVQNVKMSMYGPSFKTVDDTTIAYNEKSDEWIDVTGMTFDFSPCFMMPAAVADVKKNDFIMHNNNWVRVINVEESVIEAEKIACKEIVRILPTKSPFGFDYVTKLAYFGMAFAADESNPFGNMLPFLFMSEGTGKVDEMLPLMMMMNGDGAGESNPFGNMLPFLFMSEGTGKVDEMLPLMMMMNGKGAGAMDFSNPLMLYMMLKDSNGENSGMLPLMMMMTMNKKA